MDCTEINKYLIKDPFGDFYCTALPAGARVAFSTEFDNVPALIRIQKAYLIKSYHTGIYECHRVRAGFNKQKIQPWLDDGMVYVFD